MRTLGKPRLTSRVLRTARTIALAACLPLLAATGASAQEVDLMRHMPSAQQITARFAGGNDSAQSLGRQCAALDLLERAFFRSPAIMTPAVTAHAATRAAQQDFRDRFVQLREAYVAAVGGMDDAKQRTWSAMCERGGASVLDRPVTLDEVKAILPAELRAGYDAAFARSDRLLEENRQRREQVAAQTARDAMAQDDTDADGFTAREKSLVLGFFALGVVILGVAFYGKYRLDKYEFENTTDGGVLQFKSFGASRLHSLKRSLVTLIGLVGTIATALGIFAMLAVFTTVFD